MIGPPMAIYHDKEFKERDWDIEVCMPITDELAPDKRVKIYDLPAIEKMACVVHTGPFATIGEAYDATRQMDRSEWLSDRRSRAGVKSPAARNAGRPERSEHGQRDPVPGGESIAGIKHGNRKRVAQRSLTLSFVGAKGLEPLTPSV